MNDPVTQPRTGNVIRSTKVANRRIEIRARLLQTGARLFAERGLSNVSVEELIDAVGISRATFYGFFANKCELAVAVLIPVFDSGTTILSEKMPRTSRAKAERLVDMYLELWNQHRDALLLTGMVDSTVFPHIRKQHDDFSVAINKVLKVIENAGLLRNGDAALSYLLLAKTGIPLLRLYQSHTDFETVYRDSMLALLLKD
ncbi:MAG: TetR/AcrR family transcriptional regulator [Gammaproteobacteria bacterium]|nr:TetR/AcrR family transcriptional regulator [Gammaproteobacteria bacterium]